MSLRVLTPGDRLEVDRREPVVCIPVFGARALFEHCLRSVVEHTLPGTIVLVADDASDDPEIEAFTRRVADEAGERLDIAYLRQPVNVGFVRNMNDAFARCDPGDVVIVNSDAVVPERWLERLRDAAYSDDVVATASTLTNHGTLLSVPERDRPRPSPPAGLSLREADRRVEAGSLRLRPRLPTGVGHCLYVRRDALELVGGFDEAFSPGYGEEVDFSQRCLVRGLNHVVADDLFVYHRGAGTFTAAVSERQLAHEDLINRRYPYYARAVREAATSETIPLARSIAAARLALSGLDVTVDGSSLGPHITGTQVLTLELVAALVRHGGCGVRVRVPRSIGEDARKVLDELGVERFFLDEEEDVPTTDVVHRPFQVVTPLDLARLRRLGRRVVVSQLDLIAYRNPAYFADYAEWAGYRKLTRQVLAAVDRVVFMTEHARDEGLGEDLVELPRSPVVPLGTDHRALAPHTEPRAPQGREDLAQRPYLLCLGTDFQHKNRPFALALLGELRARHGFSGALVLAGPHAAAGTSAAAEAAWLRENPNHARHVVDLGAVEEDEKAWLYAHSALVVYPTVQEGFGLVPFEAAAAGVASLWAAHSSLAEILPAQAAAIVPWNVEATAERAAALLADDAARERLVRTVREAGARLTWDRYANRIVEVYREAAVAPARAAPDPSETLGDVALSLVGPNGYVPADVQQALLAVSTRAPLRRALFSALRTGYRALYRVRRMTARQPP